MRQEEASDVVVPVNGAAVAKPSNWRDLEYEKILRFRDQVLSGTHPRVKVPTHLKGKLNASLRTVSSPANSMPSRSTTTQQQAPAHAPQPTPSVAGPVSTPNQQKKAMQDSQQQQQQQQQHDTSSRSAAAAASLPNVSKATTELDPIFLSKSDELVKAEIQLQRQRIERSLRDQIEQRRAVQTADFLPDFDISEVLAQAIQRTHEGADGNISALHLVSDSDSFDEKTFYSSQHDTPDTRSTASHDHRNPVMIDQSSSLLAHSGSASPQPNGKAVSNIPEQKQQDPATTSGTAAVKLHPEGSGNQSNRDPRGKLPAVSTAGEKFDELLVLENASSSAKNSSNTSPANNSIDPAQDSTNSNHALRRNTSRVSSITKNSAQNGILDPIHRATHDLSPIAPQPARVHTLLNSGESSNSQLPFGERLQPTSGAAPQPASSPEGGDSEQNKKKKKDKAPPRKSLPGKVASPIPYIKPEPRSPSPFEPLSRPLKRQRRQAADGLNYDEPRRDRPKEPASYDDSLAPQPSRSAYEKEPRSCSPRPIQRDDVEYRRIASVQHPRRPLSPAQYALPYSPSFPTRVVSSRAAFERPSREPVRYYREDQIPRREVVDLDRERSRSPVFRERRSPLPMAPPRLAQEYPMAAPDRVVVDAHGRHYYAPAPVAEERYYRAAPSVARYSVAPHADQSRELVRYSVAPPLRGEPEVIYERAPIRSRPEVISDEYDDRRIVYRRPASPQYSVPQVRRLVPQPEREGTVDLRSYREREYSTRPATIAPRDEYIQIRGSTSDRRPIYVEPAREYISRASMYPEPVRYEIPREYVGRLQSVRPEALAREFAPALRAEPRRELVREASVRPLEPGVVRRETLREASVRPGETGLLRREYSPAPMDGRREFAAAPAEGERFEFARPARRLAEEPIYVGGPRDGARDPVPEDHGRGVYR